MWSVDQAIRGWYRGAYGSEYDYEWAPAPATLRSLASQEAWKVKGQREALQSILSAEPRKEYSAEHCATMVDKVTKLLRKVGYIKPEIWAARKDYLKITGTSVDATIREAAQAFSAGIITEDQYAEIDAACRALQQEEQAHA